jgi:hypothetical protein
VHGINSEPQSAEIKQILSQNIGDYLVRSEQYCLQSGLL